MKSTISTNGNNEYVVQLNSFGTVTVYENDKEIFSKKVEKWVSAAYNGHYFIYSMTDGGYIYVSDLEFKRINTVHAPYSYISIVQILPNSDRYALVFVEDHYAIFDFLEDELVYYTDCLDFKRIYGVALKEDGFGLVSGYAKVMEDWEFETWFHLGKIVKANKEKRNLEPVAKIKITEYHDGVVNRKKRDTSDHCYHIPLFECYKTKIRTGGVTEDHFIYIVPEDKTVIIASPDGKIHRMLKLPKEIDFDDAMYAYNEATDFLTVVDSLDIHRFSADTGNLKLINDLERVYNNRNNYNPRDYKLLIQQHLAAVIDDFYYKDITITVNGKAVNTEEFLKDLSDRIATKVYCKVTELINRDKTKM